MAINHEVKSQEIITCWGKLSYKKNGNQFLLQISVDS